MNPDLILLTLGLALAAVVLLPINLLWRGGANRFAVFVETIALVSGVAFWLIDLATHKALTGSDPAAMFGVSALVGLAGAAVLALKNVNAPKPSNDSGHGTFGRL